MEKSSSIVTIIGILVLAFAILYSNGALGLPLLGNTAGLPSLKGSSYQAVFLTNGLVYFGKTSNVNRDYLRLADVYYMIQQQPLLNQQPSSANAQQQQPKFTLIKLGGELHGPTDEMVISRGQVLLVSGLRDDSQVVQAIRNNKAGK